MVDYDNERVQCPYYLLVQHLDDFARVCTHPADSMGETHTIESKRCGLKLCIHGTWKNAFQRIYCRTLRNHLQTEQADSQTTLTEFYDHSANEDLQMLTNETK